MCSLSKSPSNGICFCQGTFASAGEISESGSNLRKSNQVVHFRDAWSTNGSKFREAWQDTGDTNMLEDTCISFDRFRGTIRPDHVPTCETEDNTNPGYHILGRLWALGYIRGLMQSIMCYAFLWQLPAHNTNCKHNFLNLHTTTHSLFHRTISTVTIVLLLRRVQTRR